MNLLPAVNPVVRVWDNPLCTFDDDELEPLYEYQPRLDICMRDLIPAECGRAVLVVNGVPLLQNEWYRPVLQGDVIEWHLLAGSKGTSRTVLTIIAVVVIAYFTAGIGTAYGPWAAAAFSVGANLAASLLINALIPIQAANANGNSGTSASSVYNTQLAANQARLNQPIPVIYGRLRHFPDFAAQPYAYYSANDQYYSALFCIGQGNYSIERVQIDDTPISNFHDVFYRVLPPGTAPTRVIANMVTAVEVAGNLLDADKPVGGFVVCAARHEVSRIAWDVACDQGLGVADSSGNFTSFSIAFNVEFCYVDDFGTPIGGWTRLSQSIVKAATRTPQRFTFSAALPLEGRVMVRLTRVTPLNKSNLVLNVLTWTGLRGYLTNPAPLCATATHIEVVMRASEQLNGLTQKKFNVVVRRKLRSWVTGGAGWQPEAESRSIVWAIADKWTNQVYGDKLTDDQIDLETLYQLDKVYQTRQDRLDIMFDQRVTSKAATDTMAQVGRAVAFQRMGVFTMVRDQYQGLPAASYTTRDIVPGSTMINYALITPETADQIVYEYFDNRSWDWAQLKVNVPGVTSPVNPVILRVQGITGASHALREATYLAAVNLYRRKFPKWQTELKGLLSAYGSAVIFSPALPGWGQGGDITAYDSTTHVARLSSPPIFTPGVAHFLTVEQANGQLSIAIPVTPGPDKYSVIVIFPGGFVPVITDSDSERTKYVFGPQGQHQVIVRLTNVTQKGRSPEGSPIVELSGVAENNLVHYADLPYLPPPNIVQDPVPTTFADVTQGSEFNPNQTGSLILVSLVGHELSTGTPFIYDDASAGGGAVAVKINKDGTAGYQLYSSGAQFLANIPTSAGTFPNEWIDGPPEPGFTSQYEIYATMTTTNGGAVSGTTLNTWFNLGASDYRWCYDFLKSNRLVETALGSEGDLITTEYVVGRALLQLKIRKVGSIDLLADATFSITVDASAAGNDSSGGNGPSPGVSAAVGVGDGSVGG